MNIPLYLLMIGFIGKSINWVNQIVRVAVTVKDGEVKVYPIFWFPPVVSMIVLIVYYWKIGEPVGLLGYIVGFLTYTVNVFVTIKKYGRLPWVL